MDDATDQDLAIRTILDVAGREGMAALRAAKGGTEVLIVRKMSPSHWMSQVFGYDKALEISRRLSIIDADGRSLCNVRFYVSLGQGRIQEFRAQIAREITDELLSNAGVRETALKLRVSERQVTRQRASLVADGRLAALPRARTQVRLAAQAKKSNS